MNIVVAIDSFKGSLSSMEAGSAVKEAALKQNPLTEVSVLPLADGGEGTVEALVHGIGGQIVELSVTGPLSTPVYARYGILPDGLTAVMEMSAAAGITLVPLSKRNPMYTTTFGVGELIRDAIYRGCRKFIVGIGGSATNDGGIGMLCALGYELLDCNRNPVPHGAQGLKELAAIDGSKRIPELEHCSFRVACDVTNPLCGSNGCSTVFGPQKGASQQDILLMDKWLKRYAELAQSIKPEISIDTPGAGAAGGLGFAFLAFLNATLESGIQIITEETNLESYIRNADLVITGEGRLDGQSIMGKAPVGVARIAKKYHKTVVAFSGCITKDAILCNDHGIDAYFPILPGIMTLEEALDPQTAYRNLVNTAYQVFRLMNI